MSAHRPDDPLSPVPPGEDLAPGDEFDTPAARLASRRREEHRAVDEAGGGVSEGFELAEADLIEHASHGDQHTTAPIMRDRGRPEVEDAHDVHGEPDSEVIEDA
jgi:hypothetical protein